MAKAKAAKDESDQMQRHISLDVQEEDLVSHEAVLAATLRTKDEEIERLIAERSQDLAQKHQEALNALVLDHAGKLKEAVDRAEVAEATKIELPAR